MARQEELRLAQQRAKRRRQIVIGVVVVPAVRGSVLPGDQGRREQEVATTTPTTVAGSTKSTTAAAGGPPKAKPVPVGGKLTAWARPKADGSSPRIDQFPSTSPPTCIDKTKVVTAHLTTSEGNVDITLDTTRTPNTANNYAVLAEYHYFDGTTIDRIDTSIDILQTGSPKTQDITDPGPGYNIKDEGTGFKYAAGDVVMARTSGPDSASSQYFFVVGAKSVCARRPRHLCHLRPRGHGPRRPAEDRRAVPSVRGGQLDSCPRGCPEPDRDHFQGDDYPGLSGQSLPNSERTFFPCPFNAPPLTARAPSSSVSAIARPCASIPPSATRRKW